MERQHNNLAMMVSVGVHTPSGTLLLASLSPPQVVPQSSPLSFCGCTVECQTSLLSAAQSGISAGWRQLAALPASGRGREGKGEREGEREGRVIAHSQGHKVTCNLPIAHTEGQFPRPQSAN